MKKTTTSRILQLLILIFSASILKLLLLKETKHHENIKITASSYYAFFSSRKITIIANINKISFVSFLSISTYKNNCSIIIRFSVIFSVEKLILIFSSFTNYPL